MKKEPQLSLSSCGFVLTLRVRVSSAFSRVSNLCWRFRVGSVRDPQRQSKKKEYKVKTREQRREKEREIGRERRWGGDVGALSRQHQSRFTACGSQQNTNFEVELCQDTSVQREEMAVLETCAHRNRNAAL